MEQYNIFYNKTINTVLALILPSLMIVPFLYLMARYLPNLPDSVLVPCIIALLGIVILVSLWLVKKSSRKAVLTLGKDGFVVDFSENGSSTPPSFEVKSSEIVECKQVFKNGNVYMSLNTSVAPFTFNICATTRESDDISEFIVLMQKITEMTEQKTT